MVIHHVERFVLVGNDVVPWSHISKPGELFNAIFAMPAAELDDSVPLVVMIHDGPHEAFDGSYDIKAAAFLEMGLAVLQINYRGSVGMGDASLEAIIGNIGSYDVNDCHSAINHTLQLYPKLDRNRIALFGEGFAATIALQLALMDELYGVTVLKNPIADIGAMSSSQDIAEWSYHVMGFNYSTASVPTDILASAWDLSPLSQINEIKDTATLLFIGTEDQRVLPEAQGIALYKAMRSAKLSPTSLYHYPGM